MTVSEGFKIDSGLGNEPALGRRPLVWLNCLCLDAPLVAVAWQGIFAKAFHFRLATSELIALFLTAWWIYLADRLVDSFTLNLSAPVVVRAHFSLHRRPAFALALVVICLSDAALILSKLSHAVIRDGVVLRLVALIYLF